MKRDMDLAREILAKVEELPYDGGFHNIAVNGRTPDEITYHVMLLHASRGWADRGAEPDDDGWCLLEAEAAHVFRS